MYKYEGYYTYKNVNHGNYNYYILVYLDTICTDLFREMPI